MFTLIKSLFSPAPIATRDDIPAHKGFTAQSVVGRNVMTRTFPTLAEAQVWTMARRREADLWQNAMASRGIVSTIRRAYSIRNLETGKFAPYLWTTTRADIAA